MGCRRLDRPLAVPTGSSRRLFRCGASRCLEGVVLGPTSDEPSLGSGLVMQLAGAEADGVSGDDGEAGGGWWWVDGDACCFEGWGGERDALPVGEGRCSCGTEEGDAG